MSKELRLLRRKNRGHVDRENKKQKASSRGFVRSNSRKKAKPLEPASDEQLSVLIVMVDPEVCMHVCVHVYILHYAAYASERALVARQRGLAGILRVATPKCARLPHARMCGARPRLEAR